MFSAQTEANTVYVLLCRYYLTVVCLNNNICAPLPPDDGDRVREAVRPEERHERDV